MGVVTVSVVVPVYNAERYIAECVESLLAQSSVPDEIILVNDGSTDSSGSVCDRYAAEYPETIKVVHQRNQGPLAARCSGFKASSGQFVMSIDSDDEFLQDSVALIKKAIHKTNSDVILFGYIRASSDIPNAKKQIADRFEKPFTRVDRKKGLLDFCNAVDGTLNSMCFKAVRRSCVGVDGSFESFGKLAFAEDLLQSFTVYQNARSFCYLDVPLYYYRESLTSVTRNYSKRVYRDLNIVLAEGASYAKAWEAEFNYEGFCSGLNGHRLYASARYAEFLGGTKDKEAFSEFKKTPQLKLALQDDDAKKLLRFDCRMDLWAIEHNNIALLALLFNIRSIVAKMKGCL